MAPVTPFPNFNVCETPEESDWERSAFRCGCPRMSDAQWQQLATPNRRELYQPIYIWLHPVPLGQGHD
eukprot:10843290-Prorocentrum_lima.AAC.1